MPIKFFVYKAVSTFCSSDRITHVPPIIDGIIGYPFRNPTSNSNASTDGFSLTATIVGGNNSTKLLNKNKPDNNELFSVDDIFANEFSFKLNKFPELFSSLLNELALFEEKFAVVKLVLLAIDVLFLIRD